MTHFLDLFSGIGGFALGAYLAGLRFDNHFYSEIDKYAIRVYQQRFPDAVGLGDITKIDGAKLPHGEWIISGGFPCQDISVAGKGAGLAGKRSGLWFEYARLIGELRPRYAIMENVGALTFRGLDAVLGSLAEIGYDAEWQDIRASDVGAPHRRERIWIVAYPASSERDTGAEVAGKVHALSGNKRVNDNADRPGADVADSNGSRRNGARQAQSKEWNNDTEPLGNGENVADSNGKRFYQFNTTTKPNNTEQPARGASSQWSMWATEPDVGRVAYGIPSRVDRLKCLGNAIVPQIIRLIFEHPVFDEWRHSSLNRSG